jgi:hypothetical protein
VMASGDMTWTQTRGFSRVASQSSRVSSRSYERGSDARAQPIGGWFPRKTPSRRLGTVGPHGSRSRVFLGASGRTSVNY